MSLINRIEEEAKKPVPVYCPDCNQDMKEAATCSKRFIFFADGTSISRDVATYDDNPKCGDCGIWNNPGMIHHYGCDVERCPRCKGQLLSCDCGWVRQIELR